MTTTSRSARIAGRALAAGLVLSVLGVGASACAASDNGGVIQPPATTVPTPGATTAPGASTATTPLGTLPGGQGGG